jgi:hypothetical protein
MTDNPKTRAARRSGVHHTQVRLAFLADQEHRARPAALVAVDGPTIEVQYLDGTTGSLVVDDAARLATILDRDDLCRIQDHPLLLTNAHYGVLGLATGPAVPPSKLEVLVVSRLEDGCVVELLNGDDSQPAWQILALADPGSTTSV